MIVQRPGPPLKYQAQHTQWAVSDNPRDWSHMLVRAAAVAVTAVAIGLAVFQ